jgi:hypothetical protein
MDRVITHKLIDNEVIAKRVIVCGERYTIDLGCSLYWEDVNCMECLSIGVFRKQLEGKE